MILVPSAESETKSVRKDKKYITAQAVYPFMLRGFRAIAENCISSNKMKDRDLYYGKLYIDKGNHVIRYKNEEMILGPSAYEILIYLLEHIGEAVGREEINAVLPCRKRKNSRNVDTHIKKYGIYWGLMT